MTAYTKIRNIPRSYGGIAYMGSCRLSIINSSLGLGAKSQGGLGLSQLAAPVRRAQWSF